MIWSDLYVRIPLRMEDGIPAFGRENDGDCFDEADVAQWRAGRLLSNWTEQNLLGNPATRGCWRPSSGRSNMLLIWPADLAWGCCRR